MQRPAVLGIISYKVFPAQMGGQKYIVNYYTELAKNAKVVLAVSKDNQVERYTPYKTLPFLYNHWLAFLNLIYVYRLCRIIKKERINVIMIDHSYFGWLGILLKWLTSKKLAIKSANIETLRFKDMRRIGWQLYDLYEGWVHRHADLNFFITEEEKQRAITRWNLMPQTCKTIFYGTKTTHPAIGEERKNYRRILLEKNNFSPDTKLFLFNGTLDYLPNADALYVILKELMYRLETSSAPFRIFICGNRISEEWAKALNDNPNIIFHGFEQNINKYYYGTDCFICPVTLGTGIKTKIVEALAHGQRVIACKKSGEGFNVAELGKQLTLIEDYNWKAFADAMLQLNIQEESTTPESFYRQFNWPSIVQESILSLQK